MSTKLSRLVQRVISHLPPDKAGQVDLLYPSLRNSWGGPLNGQERRRAIVRELARNVDFDVVLETGTFRGASTEFFSAVFGKTVATVEANPRFYGYSRRRLAFDPNIEVCQGDSRTFLRQQANMRSEQTTFIYLDAHWEEDLPLREELVIIEKHWKRAAVMIDDFAVPGDPGYNYDDYGPGRALTQEYLPPMPGWALTYPSSPSSAESGAKRGCAVLLSPALADTELVELRRAQGWSQ